MNNKYKIIPGTIIAIDFDGTCVTHEYPFIGKDIGAIPILQKLVEKGCILNLNTMRSGTYLLAATNWFAFNKIKLTGINEDINQKEWTKSPKVYADIYIDDAALGAPLIYDENVSERPFIDWQKVTQLLNI